MLTRTAPTLPSFPTPLTLALVELEAARARGACAAELEGRISWLASLERTRDAAGIPSIFD